MTTKTATADGSEPKLTLEQKLQKLRELYADAPDIGKAALDRGLATITQELAAPAAAQRAGRIGARQGKVSELTVFLPFVNGGANRLRGLLQLMEGNFRAADAVGTVHDMRFVFLDNDTKLLFATSYDGEWDAYIDDFVSQIPDYLDIIDSAWDGWPGIRSPGAKDYLAKHQITAEGWYVAHPDLTVAEIHRLKRIGKAVDEFLDKVGG